MQIRYVGPHAAVDLALPGNKWTTVKHGDTVEVDDAHGKSLTEQAENWAVVKEPKKPAEKPAEKADGA
jgi:hypothetical protein